MESNIKSENYENIYCKNCGKMMQNDWRFCPYCKSKIEVVYCNFCKNIIETNWKFCPYCRKRVNYKETDKDSIDVMNEWLREILSNK